MPVPQGVAAPNEAPFISCNYFSCCETTVVNPSTYLAFVQGQDVQYTLQVVAQLNVVVPVTIFFGCPNLEEIGDRWFAGANVGVGWKGIYFFLQVEYSTLGTLSDHYCIGNGQGFSITPFFTFSF